MCGLVGFIDRTGSHRQLNAIALEMANALSHRGPDDAGSWVDMKAGLALGHRRLSIHDLSPAGHQPMHSNSRRFTVVFNGEIYNFLAIRKELQSEGVAFRGGSDTEVLLASVEAWGLEAALQKFVGMFAFALWDHGRRTLYLARDRLGEKPLYYGWVGKSFMFASELKALREHPDWQGNISRESLTIFLRHSYVPAPYTIYENVHKLLPGSLLTISVDTSPGELPNPVPYWSAREVAEEGARNTLAYSDREATDQLEKLLRTSVQEKMISDVPLGAFLSGGIDSTTIVALMQDISNLPVKTFTIGFNEQGYNEADYAKSVAKYLGTDHTELYVTSKEAMDVIPKLPGLYDEPFSDSSQIPTYLVSALTRRHVTVSLSGDGGDELFGGYHRYFIGRKLWGRLQYLPRWMRACVASTIRAIPLGCWNTLGTKFSSFLPAELASQRAGERLHKAADILAVSSPEMLYRDLVSHWKDPASLVIDGKEPQTFLTDKQQWAKLGNYTQWMMYMDLVSYLPDDILVKVDRASMGVSLESRVPFIDHRIVEFAWRLPVRMKVRDGQGKWILRQVLDRYVPRRMMERPKMGFGVPIDNWLRGPLRDWVEELLDERKLSSGGFLYPGPIRKKWTEHLSGKRNWQYYLWDVLMFQSWLQAQRGDNV